MSSDSPFEFEEVSIEDQWEVPPRMPKRTPPTKPEHPSIAGLVQDAIGQGETLITAQIELFKVKAKAAGAKLGASIALFVVAAVLAIYFLWWTFHTIEVAIAVALPAWAASLIVWGLLLIVIAICVAIGVKKMQDASEQAPKVEGISDDLASFKAAVQEGRER